MIKLIMIIYIYIYIYYNALRQAVRKDPRRPPEVCIYIYIYIHTYTCIYIYIYIHIYIYIYTCIPTEVSGTVFFYVRDKVPVLRFCPPARLVCRDELYIYCTQMYSVGA